LPKPSGTAQLIESLGVSCVQPSPWSTAISFAYRNSPRSVALGHDIDGLLGMNFLSDFNFEIRIAERRILVEKIEP